MADAFATGGSSDNTSEASSSKPPASKLSASEKAKARRLSTNWKKAVLVINATRRFRQPGGRSRAGTSDSAESTHPIDVARISLELDPESGQGYGINPQELVELLALPVDVENLKKYGTTADIARKLCTNQASGVAAKDIETR